MTSVIQRVEEKYKKKAVVDLKSGDSVRVHQKIREGGKERIQLFEGLVIRTSRKNSLTASFSVRRIASGVGVEKTYLIHSPNILKIEIIKRSKVRRNYLTYIRGLTGKSTRMAGLDFDKEAVNKIQDEAAEAEEAKIHEEALAKHDELATKEAQERAKEEAKAEAALAKHQAKAEAEHAEQKETKIETDKKADD
ncbi:50S ribosomal protein L19 [Candidatus Saccharibacteria bacterium]|nr:50S ribosomal protein L19 [Candidatus Saccharibacteria bacterium]